MKELNNNYVGLTFDDAGSLIAFENKITGRQIVVPHILWRLVIADEECREIEAKAYGSAECERRDNKLIFRTANIITEFGKILPVAVEFSAALSSDEVTWQIHIVNQAPGITVRESQFPVFAIKEPQPPMLAHTSDLIGECIDDLPAQIQAGFSHFMGPDNKYIRRNSMSMYPGRLAAVNFYELDWGKDGFYYGCHDDKFRMNMHCFELEGKQINMFMNQYPFLKNGSEWRSPELVTSPYCGDLTVGAQKYRKWADSWFKAPMVPAHIKNSAGWQRLILKHQHGEYFFRYDDLEKAYDTGVKSGLDTLLLFGWTGEGMDSGYPVYTPDATQGGKEALRRNIMKVRKKGGHVVLYYNGQLIDAASEYFKSGAGARVSIKREDGTEHREFYSFFNTGTFYRMFVNKTFAVACPSCREWIDVLKRHIDLALEVGADSVFFDQLGLASYPCCDPSHGHEVPFMGLMESKRALLKELYEYTKAKNPDMGFGIECTTDQTAQYSDFVHTCGNVAQVWNPGWLQRGEPPRPKAGLYLYKIAFPEVIISDRDIKDDNDEVIFKVNQMLLHGLVNDAAVHRCRAALGQAPLYQEYLRKANALRERHKDILTNGIYRASHYHTIDGTGIQTNSFKLENRLAVIVTQSWKDSITAKITVPGGKMLEYDSINGDVTVNADNEITIPQYGFAMIIYEGNFAIL